MFLFLKLILAHLIGDFILQFEELYQLKVRSKLGHFFHALIHAVLSLLLAAPFVIKVPWFGPYLIFLACIHHFQDIFKYSIQGKHPKQIFWCFTIDQFFHFMFLCTVLLFPFSNQPLGFPSMPVLDWLYQSPRLTLLLIVLISCVFKTAYFLHAFRLSFIPQSRPLHFITSFEIWHAMIERSWIACWFLFAPPAWALAASLSIGLVRIKFPPLNNKLDFFLSFFLAAAMSLSVRIWSPIF